LPRPASLPRTEVVDSDKRNENNVKDRRGIIDQMEEIIDFESMMINFSIIPIFEIEETFPLREQYVKLLESFNDLFTSPFSEQHLDVKRSPSKLT
jgi:hypothetical protein